jgi:Cu/Ag efflux protein CusF
MKFLASLAAMTLLGTLLQPAVAKDQSGHDISASTKPGSATVTEVVRATGVIEAIDLQTRHVTLKNSHGKLVHMEIGPDARNLEQLKVGDRVRVSYAQALTLTLMKDGKELRSRAETPNAATAAAGQRPGGVMGQKVEVTADVTAVNRKSHLVTLRGTEYEVDLLVSDPEQLKLIKVGDQVHAVYTEAVALSVAPAPAGK